MAAILHSAAQRINADTAGLTHTGGEPNPGQPVAATTTELYHSVIHSASGALDSLFRMEPATQPGPVSTAIPTPAGSQGPQGGWIPSSVSGILTAPSSPSPGPGMQPPQALPPGMPGDTPQPLSGAPGGYQPISTTPPNQTGSPPLWHNGVVPGQVRQDLATAASRAQRTASHWFSAARRRLGV